MDLGQIVNQIVNQIRKKLSEIAAYFLIIFLALYYCKALNLSNEQTNLEALVENTIPSLIAVLVGYVVTYRFYKHLFPKLKDTKEELLKRILSLLKSQANLEAVDDYLEYFLDSDISKRKWADLISKSKRITIVAYYLNYWIDANKLEIQAFLQRGGEINIIASDPKKGGNLIAIRKILSGALSSNKIEELILITYKTFIKIAERAYINNNNVNINNQIKFYLSPKLLTYSFFLFDESKAAIFLAEISRDSQFVESPVIILNVKNSQKLETFFQSEISELEIDKKDFKADSKKTGLEKLDEYLNPPQAQTSS